MRIIVLCVDRDNDFGKKAGISTPIVGREKNLKAVVELGLKDSEDPDTNALLKAVSIYDDLVRDGRDVEIATICGDPSVGIKSDQMLITQLEEVLAQTKPGSAILVSDGAEDEYILPLVTSRVKVDGVKRVIVRQAQNIENTYYMIAKALRDEKIQRKFVIPIALALLVLSLAALGGYSYIGWAVVGLVLGIYLLVRVFNLEASLLSIAKDFEAGLRTGRISLFTSLLALLIVIIGGVFAYNQLMGKKFSIQYACSFVGVILWWAIVAALISIGGKVTDIYLKERRILWSYWIVPFSLVIIGLIVSIAIDVINRAPAGIHSLINLDLVIKFVLIIFVGFVGFSSYRYIREHVIVEEVEWRR